mmetsp:Transcript_106581/g.188736  ORF Transcript_106581/g.188736 Transcript_106581/m.188736 type:complete len:430 (-) Transcript_106581:29-1318(-)
MSGELGQPLTGQPGDQPQSYCQRKTFGIPVFCLDWMTVELILQAGVVFCMAWYVEFKCYVPTILQALTFAISMRVLRHAHADNKDVKAMIAFVKEVKAKNEKHEADRVGEQRSSRVDRVGCLQYFLHYSTCNCLPWQIRCLFRIAGSSIVISNILVPINWAYFGIGPTIAKTFDLPFNWFNYSKGAAVDHVDYYCNLDDQQPYLGYLNFLNLLTVAYIFLTVVVSALSVTQTAIAETKEQIKQLAETGHWQEALKQRLELGKNLRGFWYYYVGWFWISLEFGCGMRVLSSLVFFVREGWVWSWGHVVDPLIMLLFMVGVLLPLAGFNRTCSRKFGPNSITGVFREGMEAFEPLETERAGRKIEFESVLSALERDTVSIRLGHELTGHVIIDWDFLRKIPTLIINGSTLTGVGRLLHVQGSEQCQKCCKE